MAGQAQSVASVDGAEARCQRQLGYQADAALARDRNTGTEADVGNEAICAGGAWTAGSRLEAARPDITFCELCERLAGKGIKVGGSSIRRFLAALGPDAQEKRLHPPENGRSDLPAARQMFRHREHGSAHIEGHSECAPGHQWRRRLCPAEPEGGRAARRGSYDNIGAARCRRRGRPRRR